MPVAAAVAVAMAVIVPEVAAVVAEVVALVMPEVAVKAHVCLF